MPTLTTARAAGPRAIAPLGALLLLLPTVLAFFAGGYFDEPRLWAAVAVWAIVLVALIVRGDRLPARRETWLALGGLGLLAVWSLVSLAWSPVADTALASGQRLVLYAGVLAAGVLLLRERPVLRAVEPALAGGALIVLGYAVSERLLPGLLHFHHSTSAQGRLEQPLTYWNAMGEEAALALILAARLAGDATRPAALRACFAAAGAPIGLALYVSFSRGALFAAAAGLLALWFALPTPGALRGMVITAGAAVLGAVLAAPFGGVASLHGSLATREQQGAIVLVGLIVIAVAAAVVHRRMLGPGRPVNDAPPVRLPAHAPWIALAIVCVGLAAAILTGAHEHAGARLSGGAARLGTLQSDRYDYWRVALRAFGHEPLHGVGAGNWAVYWLRWRPYDVGAQDAHSLPLQTLAELGIVGFALLVALVGGLTLAARRAVRIDPVLAAGPLAGLVGYLAHSPLDWDWEMPAVSGIALVLAGAILAQAERTPAADRTESAGGLRFAPQQRRWRRPALAGAAAAAALSLAWCVISLRQVLLMDHADQVLSSHSSLTAAQAGAVSADIDDAAWLNPGFRVRGERVGVAGHTGRHAQALALATAAAHWEPDNSNTWLLLGLTAGPGTPVYRAAAVQLRRLAPPVPQPQ